MKIVDLLIVLSVDADIRIADKSDILYTGNKEDVPYSLILKDIKDFDIWINTDDGLYSPIVVLRV